MRNEKFFWDWLVSDEEYKIVSVSLNADESFRFAIESDEILNRCSVVEANSIRYEDNYPLVAVVQLGNDLNSPAPA